MKLSAVFATAFLTASVTATGWRQQPPFPCPKNIENQCTDVEQVGFDWNDLGDDVPVNEYNGYKFEGWTCGSTPGKKSRSKGTKFGNKRIGCGLSKDEFTNTISCPTKQFSVGEIEVSTDVDKVDLEIHYIMPDNSVCKKFAKCYNEGETIPNDQCGGAKAVRIKIPKSSGVKKCNLFIHKIKFVCGNKTTSVPVPTTTIPPPTPTPDCGVPGKPECATCGVEGKPDCTTDTPTPTPTPDCGVPGKPECATCGVEGKPDCTTDRTTDTSTPTPTPDCGVPGKPECATCGVEGKPDCTTAPTPTPTPDCGVPGKPECATCGVEGKPDCTTDSPTPTPTPDCGVPGKPECATCGVEGKPDCTKDSTTDPSTPTPTPECGVPGKPECTTGTPTPTPTPDCGVPGKPECATCGVEGKPDCTTDTPTPTPTPDCGVPGKPECATCGVDGKPDCATPTTDYPTITPTTTTPVTDSITDTTTVDSSSTTTTLGPDCGVEGKPECTPVPTCGYAGMPDCTTSTTTYATEGSTTTPIAKCGVDGQPECTTYTTVSGDITTTPSGPTSTGCDVNPNQKGCQGTTTTILGASTTTTTPVDCQRYPDTEGCAPTSTPTCGVAGKPDCQGTTTTVGPVVTTTTVGPVVTTYVPPPPPPSSCPDLVPKCLKTWIFKTSCTDTADAACFCPQPNFIENVADCIQAWGQTDHEIATGLSYLLGLCSNYISKHPSVVTCIPDTITLPPPVDPRTPTYAPGPTRTVIVTNDVTQTLIITPTPTPYAPPPGVTIIATVTKKEPCSPVTISGTVVTETTIVQEHTVTVPNVELIVTKTDDVQVVYPPQIKTVYQPGPTGYPAPETTVDATMYYTPTTFLTRGPSGVNESTPTMPVQYTGAASSNKVAVGLAAVVGGLLMVLVM